MPSVGLGFWEVEQFAAATLTVEAVKIGYRHLDCASDYGNEANVGDGIAEVARQGLCKRDDLWVTSKLWNTNHRPERSVHGGASSSFGQKFRSRRLHV